MRTLALVCAAAAVCTSLGASVCDVTSYGAKGDNITDDTAALQSVLADPSCATVLLPAPKAFLSKALDLAQMGGRTLWLSSGAQLVLWRNNLTYGSTHDFLYSSVSSPALSGLSITGGGVIIGGGATWWPIGRAGFRPRIMGFTNVTGLTISNLTLLDSPYWNMQLRGSNILVEGMTVIAGGTSCGGYGSAPNTDGCNVGGENITVRDMYVHNGDDCVPVTTGPAGYTRNVTVSNIRCNCGTNGGVIYNTGGSISDVHFNNMTVNGTNQGGGVKIGRPGENVTGATVANVSWSGITVTSPRYTALYVNVFNEDVPPGACAPPGGAPPSPPWLAVHGAVFRDITAEVGAGATEAACFLCAQGSNCTDFLFDNVHITVPGGQPAPPYKCFATQNFTSTGGSNPVSCA